MSIALPNLLALVGWLLSASQASMTCGISSPQGPVPSPCNFSVAKITDDKGRMILDRTTVRAYLQQQKKDINISDSAMAVAIAQHNLRITSSMISLMCDAMLNVGRSRGEEPMPQWFGMNFHVCVCNTFIDVQSAPQELMRRSQSAPLLYEPLGGISAHAEQLVVTFQPNIPPGSVPPDDDMTFRDWDRYCHNQTSSKDYVQLAASEASVEDVQGSVTEGINASGHGSIQEGLTQDPTMYGQSAMPVTPVVQSEAPCRNESSGAGSHSSSSNQPPPQCCHGPPCHWYHRGNCLRADACLFSHCDVCKPDKRKARTGAKCKKKYDFKRNKRGTKEPDLDHESCPP